MRTVRCRSSAESPCAGVKKTNTAHKQNDEGRRRFAAAVPNTYVERIFSMRKNREKLYEEYRKLGMTEEQIQAIREFDDAAEKSDKEYYAHTVPMASANNTSRRTWRRTR